MSPPWSAGAGLLSRNNDSAGVAGSSVTEPPAGGELSWSGIERVGAWTTFGSGRARSRPSPELVSLESRAPQTIHLAAVAPTSNPQLGQLLNRLDFLQVQHVTSPTASRQKLHQLHRRIFSPVSKSCLKGQYDPEDTVPDR